MNTIHIRRKLVGTVVAAATPALLLLGAGTAQAVQDVNESAPGITFGEFNPQPDPPGVDDPGIRPPLIGDPGIKVGIEDPGIKVGLGGPDTSPPLHR